MTAARHGGDVEGARRTWGRERWLDFSSNICPLGVPRPVADALTEHLSDDLTSYPDSQCRRVREIVGRLCGASEDEVLPGCGVSQLLWALGPLLPSPVLLPEPSFVDYRRSLARRGGHDVRPFHLKLESPGPSPDDLAEGAAGCRAILMGNPNNPTSFLFQPNELVSALTPWLDGGGLLVLDESFVTLTDGGAANSCWPLLRGRPNVVVFQSVTKSLALPGLRLGWVLGGKELLAKLADELPDWSVSGPATRAAEAFGRLDEYAASRRKWLIEQRKYLTDGLSNLPGVTVFPPSANFVLVRFERTTGTFVAQKLAERGILVRRCADFPGLDDRYVRLAVKDGTANRQLLAALEETLKEGER